MPNTKPINKKSSSAKNAPVETEEIKAISFSEIEDIQILVTVKGKQHLLIPKPDRESDAKIGIRSAIMLALDTHLIMDPSIDELEQMLKE